MLAQSPDLHLHAAHVCERHRAVQLDEQLAFVVTMNRLSRP
jgi:hypothetical protein